MTVHWKILANGGTKRFLSSLRKPPVSGQRAVPIGFPAGARTG